MFLYLFFFGIAELDKIICSSPDDCKKEADDNAVLEAAEFKAVNVDESAEKRCEPAFAEELNNVDCAACEKVCCSSEAAC